MENLRDNLMKNTLLLQMSFSEYKIQEIQDCGSHSNHGLFLGFYLGFRITGINAVPSSLDFSHVDMKAEMRTWLRIYG